MTALLEPITETSAFSYEEAFSRHAGLLTRDEQEKLRRSRVAIIGMGGVGGIHLVTLARLGIGRFTIADPDTYELANFNRQYGANLRTLGRSKVTVMAEEALAINPQLDIRAFNEPITPANEADFLSEADLFVDGIDFFCIQMRRRLFQRAAHNGIYSITAGPMGFSTAWLVFDPAGMSFDEYFDLKDDQTETDQLVAYAVGLAPGHLHMRYLDMKSVSLRGRSGPSSGLACQLCAGVTAAEAVKLLLGRPTVRAVPYYRQFDAYRGVLRQGRLWFGNRHPLQILKRWWLARTMASLTDAPLNAQLSGAIAR
jgi:molybdopterin/thiamine biosynthesis adenylyltransferase